MVKVLEIIADKVGKDVANKLIQDGSVTVNGGVINQSDLELNVYDLVEFDDRKICYLGANYVLEENSYPQAAK
ncbi:hypothetical protein [Desulfosporosinus sp.]|uniref:hypothetical protein n=1 Tax=Desulfosporosinus sp. TaxID=157907 RepID=UPI000E9A9B06|nr:hypothetical protein [Desulfosporosinus sp.]MBC2724638.1 hypothetical protein [Desulfosporosinus sp.]MBC2725426.1 hypothetical protein [Desulfosporosinus sp.]HBV88812.1 hypothetical protein [Desulfosporosinus sp.]